MGKNDVNQSYQYGVSNTMRKNMEQLDTLKKIDELNNKIEKLEKKIFQIDSNYKEKIKELNSTIEYICKAFSISHEHIDLKNGEGDVIMRIGRDGIHCAKLSIHNDANDSDDEELLTVDGSAFIKQLITNSD